MSDDNWKTTGHSKHSSPREQAELYFCKGSKIPLVHFSTAYRNDLRFKFIIHDRGVSFETVKVLKYASVCVISL